MGSQVKHNSKWVRRDIVSLEEEKASDGNGRTRQSTILAGRLQHRSKASMQGWMELENFHPVTQTDQINNKKKIRADLGLVKQAAGAGNYQRGWTQLSWWTIPPRNVTDKQQLIENTPPRLNTQTIPEAWTKKHNCEYMNWVYMPMYSLLLFSVSEYSPLVKSLKKKAWILTNALGFGDNGQAKSSKEGGEMVKKTLGIRWKASIMIQVTTEEQKTDLRSRPVCQII